MLVRFLLFMCLCMWPASASVSAKAVYRTEIQTAKNSNKVRRAARQQQRKKPAVSSASMLIFRVFLFGLLVPAMALFTLFLFLSTNTFWTALLLILVIFGGIGVLVYWAGPFRRKIHRAYSSSGEYDASTAANMRQFGAVMAWVGALILSGLAILFFSGGFIAVGLLLAVPAFMLGIGGWISYRNSKRVDEIK